MNKKQFKILMDTDRFKFEVQVNQLLQEGWVLHGGMSVLSTHSIDEVNPDIVFVQSFIKE